MITAQASLLSIIVFGIFSYPFNINAINCIFFTALALVANEDKNFLSLRISNVSKYTVQVAMGILLFILINVRASITIWKSAIKTWDYDEYTAIHEIDACSQTLQNNGSYLFNYGAELCTRGYYRQGIKQLNKCSRILNHVYLYNQLGQAYEKTDNFSAAERSYLTAVHMFPAMLSSRYALFKLYGQLKQLEKQTLVAREIRDMNLKVASPQVREIKKEINKFLTLTP